MIMGYGYGYEVVVTQRFNPLKIGSYFMIQKIREELEEAAKQSFQSP